ncbi:MAG: hypothetical protein NTW29_19990 [Bacteroidetes bacterium]|nr:hypothetical protein [Bacteroidota bacterium]
MRKLFHILIVILLALPAKAQTVYKTPSGEKYHLATCHMVKNTSEKISLEQAIALGLGPCKFCGPPIPSASAVPEKKPQGQLPATVQCRGYTKAGTRCKHFTRIGNGFCFQHQPR